MSRKVKSHPNSLANLKKIQKGQVLNPEGGRSHDKEKRILKSLTVKHLKELIDMAVMGNEMDLDEVIENPYSSIVQKTMAKALKDAVKSGNWFAMENIINRIVGKVPDKVAYTDPTGEEQAGPVIIEFVDAEKR